MVVESNTSKMAMCIMESLLTENQKVKACTYGQMEMNFEGNLEMGTVMEKVNGQNGLLRM